MVTAMITTSATVTESTAMALLRNCLYELRRHRGEDTMLEESVRAWRAALLERGMRAADLAVAPRWPSGAVRIAAAQPEGEAAATTVTLQR